MTAAIKIENLGKQFRIGPRLRYRALRDSLSVALAAPWRLLRGANGNSAAASGNGSAVADDSRIWALQNVSLEIAEGEAVGLIGRNGAGKTTLLKILARITRPTTGCAEVHGRIGSLLEVGTGFHPELTGRENVFLSGALLGMKRDEIRRRFDEIIAFSGVEKFLDTPLKHYSTGMQTRLAFAVAAHLDPEILLVDEVLAVGDLEFQKKCLGKMESVSRAGRTVVFVSHQMNQIRRLCEKVVWLEGGQVQQSGPAARVIGAYEAAMTTGQGAAQARPDGPKLPARFLHWKLRDRAEESRHVLETSGPVTVQFTLQVNERLSHVHHGVALYSSDGQLVWAWGVNNLTLEPGQHVFEHSFDSVPLRPGVYSWLASVYEDGDLVDMWNCVPEMIIAAPNHQHHLDEWNGILNLPSRFSVRSEPAP